MFQKISYTFTRSKRNNYNPFENAEGGCSSLQKWHDKTVKTPIEIEEQVKSIPDKQDTNL